MFNTRQAFGAATTGLTSGNINQLSQLFKTSYDVRLWMQLRTAAVFQSVFADRRRRIDTRGATTRFTFLNDIAAQTTALLEATDPSSVALGTSTLDISVNEYGVPVSLTTQMRELNFVDGFDAEVAERVSWNAVDTTESLARTAMDASGTERIKATNTASLRGTTAGHRLQTTDLRQMHAQLQADKVKPVMGMYYLLFAHPYGLLDLIEEPGSATNSNVFMEMAIRQNMDALMYNEATAWGGFMIISTPRAEPTQVGGRDVYTAYAVGDEAYAVVPVNMPQMVMGPTVDKLERFTHIGWKCLMGWGQFRSAASRRLRYAASLGDNT